MRRIKPGMISLLVAALFTLNSRMMTTDAHRVFVLDTANSSVATSISTNGDGGPDEWAIRALGLAPNGDELSGWAEETYRDVESGGDANERAFVTCNVHATDADSWLRSPRIERRAANRLHVEVTFTLRECSAFPHNARTCKETLEVWWREEPPPPGKMPEEWWHEEDWELLTKLAGRGGAVKNRETRTLTPKGKAVYLAFRDRGACVSVLSVKVYYDVCEASRHAFALFPETVTAAESTELLQKEGECVRHAETPTGARPVAICKSDGRWETVVAGAACQCRPGYLQVTTSSTCAACPPGTYKTSAGAGDCRTCPANSEALRAGSPECACRKNHWRTAEEGADSACSRPPSRPRNLRAVSVDTRSAVIEWEAPEETGGRKELWYRVACTYGCDASAVHFEPSAHRVFGRSVRLTGLSPGERHTLLVYAENELSRLTDVPASYAPVEFTTAPSFSSGSTESLAAAASHSRIQSSHQPTAGVGRLIVDGEQEGGVTIAWAGVLHDVDENEATASGDVLYEVEIQANDTTQLRTTRNAYYTAHDLAAGVAHQFRVRGRRTGGTSPASSGWSKWSEPLWWEPGRGQIFASDAPGRRPVVSSSRGVNTPTGILAGLRVVPLWMIILLVLLSLLLVLCAALVCRRKGSHSAAGVVGGKRRKKQFSDLDVLDTYKQDTMTPDYRHHHNQSGGGGPGSAELGSNGGGFVATLHDCFRPPMTSTKLHAPLISTGGGGSPPRAHCLQQQTQQRFQQQQQQPYLPNNHNSPLDGFHDISTHRGSSSALISLGGAIPVVSTDYADPAASPSGREKTHSSCSRACAFEIDRSAVVITAVVGGGEFGDVCKGGLNRAALIYGGGGGDGVDNDHSAADAPIETVAIKTLKSGSGMKARQDFLMEAFIMGQFQHENVIRLIGVVTRSEPVMILTEYMANGSLDHFLRAHDTGSIDIQTLCLMMRGIAAGMRYLTDKSYVHRDLAARNVLVAEDLTCKIADFGLSRGLEPPIYGTEQEYMTNGGKIPVRWTAPEAITHRKFSAASDVWSFGILMWEVCSFAERPYWEWTNQKVIAEVTMGYRLPAPMDTPPALHRLMLACWRHDRHERPTFHELFAALDRYCRLPELMFTTTASDSMMATNAGVQCQQQQQQQLMMRGVQQAHSCSNVHLAASLAGTVPTGQLAGCSTPTTVAAASAGYQTQPRSLEKFLRMLALSHCLEQLQANGVRTVGELARLSHLDLLAFGLISEEYERIRDALGAPPRRSRLGSGQSRFYGASDTTVTTSSGGSSSPPSDHSGAGPQQQQQQQRTSGNGGSNPYQATILYGTTTRGGTSTTRLNHGGALTRRPPIAAPNGTPPTSAGINNNSNNNNNSSSGNGFFV